MIHAEELKAETGGGKQWTDVVVEGFSGAEQFCTELLDGRIGRILAMTGALRFTGLRHESSGPFFDLA